MVQLGLFFLAAMTFLSGLTLIANPNALKKLNERLSENLWAMDEQIYRFRYFFAVMLCGVSILFVRFALML